MVALVLYFWTSRVNELFCVSVRDGNVLVVRGRIPGRLLSDIRDVVSKPAVPHGTICATKQEHGVRDCWVVQTWASANTNDTSWVCEGVGEVRRRVEKFAGSLRFTAETVLVGLTRPGG